MRDLGKGGGYVLSMLAASAALLKALGEVFVAVWVAGT